MMIKTKTWAVVLNLALAGLAGAALDRGVWFWGSTTLPGGAASTHGSSDVVGDAAEEDAMIAFLTARGVTRVYGSYQNRPVSELAVIAAWNAKLDAAGIDSQLLIEGTQVDNPTEVANIQNKITNRLITFNNTVADPAQRFDALHLDLEPQQLGSWDADVVGDVRRGLLDDLADAYALIRTQLDTAGYGTVPMYADLNFSWDKLPADGGSILWADGADRDGWYGGIGVDLAGISIMTFSKDNAADLADATAYERTGSFPGSVVVGMQPRTGVGELWANYTEFKTVMEELEGAIGTAEATDIENYAFWRHAVATGIPVLTAGPAIIHSGLGGGGGVVVVVWDWAKPGYKYVIEENDDPSQPGGWREVASHTTVAPDRVERFEYQADVGPGTCFWRVGVVAEP